MVISKGVIHFENCPSLSHLSQHTKYHSYSFLVAFLSSYSHRYVKGSPSDRIALKVDVTGPENILFAGTSMHLSAQKCYRLGQLSG